MRTASRNKPPTIEEVRPDMLKIFGEVFAVKWQLPPGLEKDRDGHIDFDRSTIYVDGARSLSRQLEILLHEAQHVINWKCEILDTDRPREERIARVVGTGMAALLIDNERLPKFAAFVAAKVRNL